MIPKMNDGEKTVENKKIIGNFAASTFKIRKAGVLARKRVKTEVPFTNYNSYEQVIGNIFCADRLHACH